MPTTSKKLSFLFLLSKANSIINRRFTSQSLGFGDIAVMQAISQSPGGKIRRVDLAEQLGLTASGVTRMLLPLEKIGVIKREANDRDARVSYAALTKAGQTMLTESLESAELLCDDLIPDAKIKNLEEFCGILNNI